MRIILIGAVLLLTACATTPPPEPAPRGSFAWGTPRAQVLEHQAGEPVVAPADRLVYHVERAGVPLTLTYEFVADGLRSIRYFNRAGHAEDNRYIDDFERLKSALIERHGMPRLDRMVWSNRMLADDPERYGDAIAAGHLVYYTEWRTPDGRIVMALRGERLQVAHELAFTPPKE